MRIDIVTLFPGMVEPVLGASMLGRARARGLVDIRVLDLRDYAKGKRRITDDYQFGGGGGMVLKPEPLFAAVEALRTPGARVILLDPRGRTFTQKVAAELARETHLILLAGRYEGVDARVSERLVDDSIERVAGAAAVHAARGVPGRTRAGGAPLRGSRADRPVAAGAGALAHVAGTAGALEEHGSDIRRAAARRTIRTRGDAGADRRLRALAAWG